MVSNSAKDNFGHVNSAKGLKNSLGQSCFLFPQRAYETKAYCSPYPERAKKKIS